MSWQGERRPGQEGAAPRTELELELWKVHTCSVQVSASFCALSSLTLNVYRGGASTTSLDNLCHSKEFLTAKNFFLRFAKIAKDLNPVCDGT